MKKIMISHPKKLTLIAISLFLSMVFIDETGISVTLPMIQKDFHMTSLGIQWIMNGMFLPLAVLVLFGGKLSDHLGYRNIFTTGMIIFVVASILCGIATNSYEILIGRVMQGVGASFMLATYAVLIALVFNENERGNALGSCASVASIFLATGPFIGGFFTYYLNWHWIFLINFPIGLVCLYFIYLAIPKDVIISNTNKFDINGVITFVLGFSLFIYALMQTTTYGWNNATTLFPLITAIILLTIFFYSQYKKSNPFLNLKLFSNKNFLSGNIILLCTQIPVMTLTYWALWLQYSLEYSPLLSGIALLPAGIPILLTAKIGGILADKKGVKLPIILGSIIVLLGILWLAITAHYESYGLAIIGFLCYAIGAPFVISPAIGLVLNSVDPNERGVAAGVLNTMRQLGATLCFAIVGVVITTFYQMQNSSHVHSFSYTNAFSYGMWVTALFALVAFIFSVKIKTH